MKANKNREIYYNQRLSKSSEHKGVDARSKMMEMEEKRELDTMNKVILKHHQKAMAMRKKDKEEHEKREYYKF